MSPGSALNTPHQGTVTTRPSSARRRSAGSRSRRVRRSPYEDHTTGPDAAAADESIAAASSDNTANTADLQFYRYGAPLPSSGGQPCPPDIPPIELSATRPHRAPRPRLESRAPHHSPPRLSPALVRLAAPPPSPRPMAPLQHPATDHGSHLINGGRKEVTRCNRKPGNHVTIRDTAAPDRETATVLRASCGPISRRATATPTTTRSGRCPGSRMLRLKLLPPSRITRTTRSAHCSARSTCCAVSWRRKAARSCAPAAALRSSARLARRLSSRRQRAGSGPTAASTRLAKKEFRVRPVEGLGIVGRAARTRGSPMTAGVFESAAPSGPDGEGQARGQARARAANLRRYLTTPVLASEWPSRLDDYLIRHPGLKSVLAGGKVEPSHGFSTNPNPVTSLCSPRVSRPRARDKGMDRCDGHRGDPRAGT